MSKNTIAYILLIFATLFWSGNFIVGKAASLFEIPPFTLNFYRWLCAWLVLAPFTLGEIFKKRNYILENIKLLFYIGLFIRIILAVYTSQVHTWTKMISMDELVILGNDPFLRATAFGPLNYLFYMPTYAIYEFLRIIGIEYMFIALSLMRIPAILGDIILMFAVYQLIINLTNKKKLALFGASILFLNPYIIYTLSLIHI